MIMAQLRGKSCRHYILPAGGCGVKDQVSRATQASEQFYPQDDSRKPKPSEEFTLIN